jgi:plasminogen activator inhibitor 1 RNA-binding protein
VSVPFPFIPSSSHPPPVDGERRGTRGRGRGTDRGDRGADRGARGRTFDRHSATGKTCVPFSPPSPPSSPCSDSDKKIHNGWGGDDGNAELKAEEAATVDAAAESTGNDWGAPAEAPADDWAAPAADTSAGDWGAPPQDAAPGQSPSADKTDGARRTDRNPEEEDNTLTLDQYLAQQKEKENALLPKLETRKANEGAEEAVFNGATRLDKGEGEAYFSGKVAIRPSFPIHP